MTRPIIVGVDGSGPSLQAASWAGAEAALHGAPLRILHAALRWSYDVPLVPQPAGWDADARSGAAEMLRQATLRARAGRPRLDVTAEIVDGGAADALVAATEEARLLVVGNRGRGGFTELLLGSVSRTVTARASCPVAVVRWTSGDDSGDQGDVVVGVTGRPGQDDVLDFAFGEAGLRGVGVLAVHAWRHPARLAPGDIQPPVYDIDEVGREEERLVAVALAGRMEAFPDVPSTRRVVHAHPAKALIAASAHASLVVIGAHAERLTRPGLGSIAHAITHHGHSPVVVVRH
ncbi:universal stress protein [Spongiactinospora rosea]|uniref:Universal stress protein n=1 Tax=Spongiactinospora rosea TaxID=2248750 RepID=A0A366LRK6_9ACTN|nr:universal stress protein [Spongiactinospora rosea]RBQ15832.1 universal stress protein [Spongiactinospora rosea]